MMEPPRMSADVSTSYCVAVRSPERGSHDVPASGEYSRRNTRFDPVADQRMVCTPCQVCPAAGATNETFGAVPELNEASSLPFRKSATRVVPAGYGAATAK